MLCPCGTGIKWSRVSSRLQTHEITHLCGHVTLSKSGPWQSRFLWDCPMVLLSRSLASVSEESSDPLHMDAKHVETPKYSFNKRTRFCLCDWSSRQTNACPGFHIVGSVLCKKDFPDFYILALPALQNTIFCQIFLFGSVRFWRLYSQYSVLDMRTTSRHPQQNTGNDLSRKG